MSRSTGWQSPAVPPVWSASHPGENTSEQPSGKCGGLLRRTLLQRDDVFRGGGDRFRLGDSVDYPTSLLIERFQM